MPSSPVFGFTHGMVGSELACAYHLVVIYLESSFPGLWRCKALISRKSGQSEKDRYQGLNLSKKNGSARRRRTSGIGRFCQWALPHFVRARFLVNFPGLS